MTWVDFVLLAVVLISALLAFFRGLVREVLSIAAWLGAAVAGVAALPQTRPLADQYVQPDWLATGIAIGAVFLVVLLILQVLIHWIAGLVRSSFVGGIDRALGFLFGAARGAFIIVLAYIVAGLLVQATETWPADIRQARALPYVQDAARRLVEQLPEDFRPRLPDGVVGQNPTLDQLLRPPARNRT